MPETGDKYVFRELQPENGIGFSIGLGGEREFKLLVDESSQIYSIEDHVLGLMLDKGKNRHVGLVFKSDSEPEKVILKLDNVELNFDQHVNEVTIKNRWRLMNGKSFDVGMKVGENGDLQVTDKVIPPQVSLVEGENKGYKAYSFIEQDGSDKNTLCVVIIKGKTAYVIDFYSSFEPWIYRVSLTKFTDNEFMPFMDQLNQGILDYSEGERDPEKLLKKFGSIMGLIGKRMWSYSKELFLDEVGSELLQNNNLQKQLRNG